MENEDAAYHRDRATREMNLGLSSSNVGAARAHLRLSTLHAERARALEEQPELRRPPFSID